MCPKADKEMHPKADKTVAEPRFCAVIPTYNNAGTLMDVVRRTHAQLDDIVVVDDGSTDGTAALLAASPVPVAVVRCGRNRGKGHALREGFRRARAEGFTHAVTIDADGQHYPEDLPQLLAAAREDPVALIVGSRPLDHANMPRGNTFANRFSNFWFRVQTGIDLPDTQTGLRIYPLAGLRGERWMTSRYEAELELLVASAWAGVRLRPVTVRVDYPEDRVSHFRPTLDFLRISLLNTLLCLLAVVYGWPRTLLRKLLR